MKKDIELKIIMKNNFLGFALLSLRFTIIALIYNAYNSLYRIALTFYHENGNGFIPQKENVNFQEMFSIVSTYGYNKKHMSFI